MWISTMGGTLGQCCETRWRTSDGDTIFLLRNHSSRSGSPLSRKQTLNEFTHATTMNSLPVPKSRRLPEYRQADNRHSRRGVRRDE
ncbi:protein of unknown function [Nitrospira japonica]|uniref:Uncharacterized protein n=1 Tax=Nitrospira japonica TaxID=1325564 RepID=A0A1W1I2G7_9BACT|nr:protein of unknown function [Nitrospira japonica]